MSNIDSDGFVDIPSSLDSVSDISKDVTKTDVVSPSPTHEENKKQLSDIPDDWKPPSEPRARRRFTRLCTFILKQPDLEEVWQVVRKENGWKTYNQPMLDEVASLRVGQALVLLASLACLMSPGSEASAVTPRSSPDMEQLLESQHHCPRRFQETSF